MKAKELLEDIIIGTGIEYVIYGNFNFVENGDEDIDVLIKQSEQLSVIKYLEKERIEFHMRKYYPNQIFITEADIKIHMTDDLYIGGRRVQYLMKTFLVTQAFQHRLKWNGIYIISFQDYQYYRKIKSIFNKRKKLKLEEYPKKLIQDKYNQLEFLRMIFKMIILNSIYIPTRFIRKHVWAKL